MNQGQIEQVGTLKRVYTNPATPFVYNFLGNVNLFHGRVENGKLFLGDKEIKHSADSKRRIINLHLHSGLIILIFIFSHPKQTQFLLL